MFGGGMLAALVCLLLVGVVARQPALFLLALALLVAAGLSRLWERHCLTGVEYRRRLSQRQVPFGEEVTLEVEIVNRKLLPLSWLETEDELPAELPPARGRVYPAASATRAILGNLVALRPYERVRRRYSLPCGVRGEHLFGPVRLRSGDLFGFVTCEALAEATETLVVYPRVLPLADLGLPARQPLGDLRARSWIFEDASRLAGAREHRPGDGLRRIHWAATARTQQLHSKVYEATTSHSLAVALNLATSESHWWSHAYDPDALELAISTAASVASWALGQGFQVGVATNGMHRGSWDRVGVPPSRDPGQLERILLALGRLRPFAVQPFEETLAQELRRLPYGTSLVVVTAALAPTLAAVLLGLRARGHAVAVVLTGRAAGRPALDGIAVRQASWEPGERTG